MKIHIKSLRKNQVFFEKNKNQLKRRFIQSVANHRSPEHLNIEKIKLWFYYKKDIDDVQDSEFIELAIQSYQNQYQNCKPTKIECKLHKIELSSTQYDYNDVFEHFDPTKQILDSSKKDLLKGYQNHYYQEVNGFDIYFLLNPKSNQASLYMSITPDDDVSMLDYKAFLTDLNDKLPGLNVSKVEYATDLLTHSANQLKTLLSKFLFIPYAKKVNIEQYGMKFEGDAKKKDHNDFRFYERGNDGQFDRVRLEFIRKFHKINLQDFIQNPNFLENNKDSYKFKIAKDRNKRGKFNIYFNILYRFLYEDVILYDFYNPKIRQDFENYNVLNSIRRKALYEMRKLDRVWSQSE